MHSKHRHIDGKSYFISDAHFGIPNFEESLEREKKLVRWLDEIKSDAKHIFLLGDIFDFWFEYKGGTQELCANFGKISRTIG